MIRRLALCALLVAGCKSSTGPDLDVTGNWAGTWATTTPPGPSQLWTANLTQAGTAVTGSFNCAATETYTLTGTNLHNALTLTLVGSFGDSAFFTGSASNSGGVQASGHFSDSDGAGCFTGFGDWSGRIQ
ncbi:MAG TPA: hypothetical protein VNX15_11540 [Gemmatimonadales bacterium]|jgi:hypothetical protein|nr:hypothetical protein [Gemmatimonadales bacterium]